MTIITGAKLFPISAPPIQSGYIVLENGKITAIGDGEPPQRDNAIVIDATGAFITPGVIDTHSHMGVYANPSVRAHSDGNEMVGPVTGDIWAEHGFWPQDPSIRRAISGGVTTIQVLPGSANLIGGRSYIAKLKPGSQRVRCVSQGTTGSQNCCGENPKRVYGSRGGPRTRMGNVAGFRNAFQRARNYLHSQEAYERDLKAWKDAKEKTRTTMRTHRVFLVVTLNRKLSLKS